MLKRFRLALALLLLAFAAAPATAQIDSGTKVMARLVAEHDAIAPGGTMAVALEEVIRKGWHTYWANAGDAGGPPEIHWTLPAGWKVGAIQWPYPRTEAVGPLMDYGYEGKTWLLMDVSAPKDAKPGSSATLKAVVNFLVCAEVCVPEDANVAITLKVGTPSSAAASGFAAARAHLPIVSPWPMRYRAGQTLDLFIAAPTLAKARPVKVNFFPLQSGWIKGIAPQQFGFAEGGLVLRLQPAKAKLAGALRGVLVLTSSDGSVQALQVNALPGSVPDAGFGTADDMGLLLALLFAFLGGLILNLMPCVLPILAMKAFALASHGGSDGADARSESLAYGAGAMLSFLGLGALVVGLRAAGAAIGWGFQLQEPLVVAGFAILLFAVGLNLSGVFELPGFGGGDSLTRRSGAVGAFFTGVLAVAVAAPCTAPFMAAALGYALTQPAILALAVFLALGIGFAAPFVAIGFSPYLLRALPRPGPWMLRLKQAFAFPMYGASVWLVWVLANQSGANGVAVVLAAMVALGLAVWLWQTSRDAGPRGRGIGALLSLIAFIAALALLAMLRNAPAAALAQNISRDSEPYSAARLESLRVEKRAVFLDATAAWCITCLVNEQAVLSRPAIKQAFATHHVAYLIADWTNRNAAITALLTAHQRSGVPLYLYYAPGADDAVVLPQILTENDVLNVLGR